MVQLSNLYITTGKSIALTIQTFVGKVMSLFFNMQPRFVIVFLPRSNHLLVSWLQSPSVVILEPKKIKYVTASTFSPFICHDKRWLLNKQQYPKLKNLVHFFAQEDSRVWTPWNHSFDIPAIWDHILCFHILRLRFSGLTVRSGPAWWLLDHRYSSSWVPSGLTGLHWRAAVAEDCDSLVYWDGRTYSTSHSLWGPISNGSRIPKSTAPTLFIHFLSGTFWYHITFWVPLSLIHFAV